VGRGRVQAVRIGEPDDPLYEGRLHVESHVVSQPHGLTTQIANILGDAKEGGGSMVKGV
jgi:hypothetical protein